MKTIEVICPCCETKISLEIEEDNIEQSEISNNDLIAETLRISNIEFG